MSPHIVAREAGLNIDLVKVTLSEHKTETGADYYSINPKGYVPALELDNGEILTEGVAIIQYLADQKPEKNLAPAPDTFERYRLQEWLTFISSELHKTFSPLWDKTFPEEMRKRNIERLHKRFTFLEKHLATHEFLMNDYFSVADAYCFTIIRWSNILNVDVTPFPKLKAYVERIASRPAIQMAMKAEGLVK